MQITLLFRSPFSLGLATVLLITGCATTPKVTFVPAPELRVNQAGQIADTGLQAMDLMVACKAIHQATGSVPEVAHRRGPVRIAVEPVVNDSRLAVDEATFNEALGGQLRFNAPLQLSFLAAHQISSPDFFLANRLQRIRPEQPVGYEIMVYTFQLIDAGNSEIVMEGSFEIKNHALGLPGRPVVTTP